MSSEGPFLSPQAVMKRPRGHILFTHQNAVVLGGMGTAWNLATNTWNSPVTSAVHAGCGLFLVLQVEVNTQASDCICASHTLPLGCCGLFHDKLQLSLPLVLGLSFPESETQLGWQWIHPNGVHSPFWTLLPTSPAWPKAGSRD